MAKASDAHKIFAPGDGLGILFEVVDDPEDHTQHFSHVKPVDVWLFVSKQQLSSSQSGFAAVQKHGSWIPRITKATPPELRAYSLKSFKSGFLYVFAVPTPEWAGIYTHRQYGALPISSGRYNFAVSLPALPAVTHGRKSRGVVS
jgi:hypothetical protein